MKKEKEIKLFWDKKESKEQCPKCKKRLIEAINGDYYRCDWCVKIYKGQNLWILKLNNLKGGGKNEQSNT